MNFVNYATLHDDIIRFTRVLPRDFDLIVGVPRSGLLPALLLSLHYNIPLSELLTFAGDKIFKSGTRGGVPLEVHKVLVVDDSSLSGGTITRTKRALQNKKQYDIKYGVLYVTDVTRKHVDYFLRVVPWKRCFQWNIMHHSFLENACMDIDGVLCYPPTPAQNDDGAKYIDFIQNTKPLYIPSFKVKCLATCRLLKYMKQTKEWLSKYGVKYDELYMMNYPNKAERVKARRYAEYKAEIYLNTKTELFIEDEVRQAQKIAQITKKPVLCVGNWTMY